MAHGFYHFATYNTDPPTFTVSVNIGYPADSEGTWVYLYICYRRLSEKRGNMIGFVNIHNIV
jgi:outer membrane protease